MMPHWDDIARKSCTYGPGHNFEGSTQNRANLRLLNLTRVNLKNAQMQGTDFCYSRLVWANLQGADLAGANFTGVDLTGADLQGASLAGADFTRADLTGADLRGAVLTGADFSHAVFNNTLCTTEQLFWFTLLSQLHAEQVAGCMVKEIE
jgi:uncharacterized protein YjbI with pentapeptide repeats